jgi:cell division GTPase FtsZ
MNKNKVLVLGTGQAGGNIAEEMAGLGYETLAFNTANSDLDKLEKVTNKIVIGNTEGSGKNRNLSKDNFSKERSKVREALQTAFKNSKIELVIIPFGAGGGTGSGSAVLLAEEVKALGKKAWLAPIMFYEGEGKITKINCTSFIRDYEKVKDQFPCFIFNNTSDTQAINKYIATSFDELINEGNSCETVFDFRDLMNTVRNGYNFLGRGMGNQIKVHADILDKTQSKYATLIKTAQVKQDGYSVLSSLNYGMLDRNCYHITGEQEKWILLLGGMKLDSEVVKELQSESQATISEIKKKDEVVNLDLDTDGIF